MTYSDHAKKRNHYDENTKNQPSKPTNNENKRHKLTHKQTTRTCFSLSDNDHNQKHRTKIKQTSLKHRPFTNRIQRNNKTNPSQTFQRPDEKKQSDGSGDGGASPFGTGLRFERARARN